MRMPSVERQRPKRRTGICREVAAADRALAVRLPGRSRLSRVNRPPAVDRADARGAHRRNRCRASSSSGCFSELAIAPNDQLEARPGGDRLRTARRPAHRQCDVADHILGDFGRDFRCLRPAYPDEAGGRVAAVDVRAWPRGSARRSTKICAASIGALRHRSSKTRCCRPLPADDLVEHASAAFRLSDTRMPCFERQLLSRAASR